MRGSLIENHVRNITNIGNYRTIMGDFADLVSNLLEYNL